MTATTPSTALEAMEEAMASTHPHLFPEELTSESVGLTAHGLAVPAQSMADILEWAGRCPSQAAALAKSIRGPSEDLIERGMGIALALHRGDSGGDR